MRATVALVVLGFLSSGLDLGDSRNTVIRNPDWHYTPTSYESRAEWESRKWLLRRQILNAAGLLPQPNRTPLNPRILDHVERPGYIVENIFLETLPGYYLGGTLYRPSSPGVYPGVLLPHGHWKGGRHENRRSYSVPALGINLALQGYVAFAYDMVGYNDTKQTGHSFGGWREQLWSFNPLGLQLWNSMRSVDYLQSRRDVDSSRIGVTGASGGGTQTFLLTAVDDRIRVAAPVNMISAHMQGGDPCEEAPGLRWNGANNVEFGAMAAPKPMLVVSCTGDWTRNTPVEEFPFLQRIWTLYKEQPAIANAHFEGEHNYNRESREAVYAFFARNLQRPQESFDKYHEQPVPESDVTGAPVKHWDRMLPPNALTYDQLFAQWIAVARRRGATTRDPEAVRERLRFALGAQWPARVDGQQVAGKLLLTRPGVGDRVPAEWHEGAGDALVVIHPDGMEAARSSPLIREHLDAHHAVLLVDVFQTGQARASRDRSDKWFLSYNQTDDANRVQDVLTAVSYARALSKRKVRLVGLENAGVWCLFAAAVAPVDVEVTADLVGFEGSDEDFHKRFFVPGIQRAGGLDAALRLLKRPRVRR